jgi:hypothetical protein
LLVTTGVGVADAETDTVSAALEVGSTKVGVSERVAFPELGGMTAALLAAAEEAVEAGTSDAGTLLDRAGDGVTIGAEDAPDPEAPEGKTDGTIPDEVSLALAAGGVKTDEAALGDTERVSLGIGRLVGTLADTEGVETAPDGVGSRPEAVGRTPEGTRPEESSDAMLEAMPLAAGREAGTVALGNSEAKLDTMLGMTDTGTSGTTEDKRLVTSESNEETSGGKIPDGAAEGATEGAGVGDGETGAVGPAEPEGKTPVTSETTEDKSDGRLRGSEGKTASDVGIAPELNAGVGLTIGAPVPSAVVIPTTIPPEDS